MAGNRPELTDGSDMFPTRVRSAVEARAAEEEEKKARRAVALMAGRLRDEGDSDALAAAYDVLEALGPRHPERSATLSEPLNAFRRWAAARRGCTR